MRFVSVILLIPVVFSLLGTGQRAFFVGFVIVAFLLKGFIARGKITIGRVEVIFTVIGFFVLFSYMSLALGRSGGNTISDDAGELLSRIFSEQQIGSIFGFRYTYHLPVQYGSDWADDLMSILPGEHGTHLSNKIHEILYGSDRGTVPISMWTSVVYNWGYMGVFVFPFFLSLFYSKVTFWMISRSKTTIPELVGYAFLSFILASWVSAGPMQLINNGLVTVCLMLGIMYLIAHSKLRWAK
ncbi:hypothetical protein GCM10008098_20650 [Rhodanobacter panaciterrae]|uniref:Oligosaccharide repeat unit polymerase n=1 Tax=Rhodanobacter panaciterrae TaxID=490572 RepID=A0ABQ2ZW85_9GAMM|nr:hypothetical protein GCM10008098_20650 [Rhodanobacter panaciterrae]